jgi:hypothetical protein
MLATYRLTIQADEKDSSFELLRMLLALPVLLEHLANALRIAKGLGMCPPIRSITIAIKPGMITPTEPWTCTSPSKPRPSFLGLEDGRLALSILACSPSPALIPSENELVEKLMGDWKADNPTMAEHVKQAQCAAVNEAGKAEFVYPQLPEACTWTQTFSVFCGDLSQPVDMAPYVSQVSASMIFLNAPQQPPKAVSVAMPRGQAGFALRYAFDEQLGLFKLAVRFGGRLVYTKVFIRLPNDRLGKLISEYWCEKQQSVCMFASTEPGLQVPYGKFRAMAKGEKSTAPIFEDRFSLQTVRFNPWLTE